MTQETFNRYCEMLDTNDIESLALLAKLLQISQAWDGIEFTGVDDAFIYKKTIAHYLYLAAKKNNLQGVYILSETRFGDETLKIFYFFNSWTHYSIWD